MNFDNFYDKIIRQSLIEFRIPGNSPKGMYDKFLKTGSTLYVYFNDETSDYSISDIQTKLPTPVATIKRINNKTFVNVYDSKRRTDIMHMLRFKAEGQLTQQISSTAVDATVKSIEDVLSKVQGTPVILYPKSRSSFNTKVANKIIANQPKTVVKALIKRNYLQIDSTKLFPVLKVQDHNSFKQDYFREYFNIYRQTGENGLQEFSRETLEKNLSAFIKADIGYTKDKFKLYIRDKKSLTTNNNFTYTLVDSFDGERITVRCGNNSLGSLSFNGTNSFCDLIKETTNRIKDAITQYCTADIFQPLTLEQTNVNLVVFDDNKGTGFTEKCITRQFTNLGYKTPIFIYGAEFK